MTDKAQGGTDQFTLWGSGIDYEVDFWSHWFATRGGQWPVDFDRRIDA